MEQEDYLYWLYGLVTGNGADSAVMDLSETGPVVTTVPEAVHFQKGLHTIAVRAMEMNIPIRGDGEGNADWATVQEAWWTVQDLVNLY